MVSPREARSQGGVPGGAIPSPAGVPAVGGTASTGSGPNFPSSSGDREKGKFRLSDFPRLTVVAVSNDDGMPIAATTNQILAELLHETRLLRHALVLGGLAADIDEPFD